MTFEWGESFWGESFWGDAIAWGARENGDPSDLSSPLVVIPPGSLNALQTARDRIWKQYEGTESWQSVMGVIGDVFAGLDATLGSVDQQRYRYSAVGVQLDAVGAKFNRPRGSLVDDDQYRLAILVDAATLFASGTVPELLALANLLTDQDPEVTEFFPASYRLRLPNLDSPLFRLLLDILGDVPAAGVGALLSTYNPATTGGWSSTRSRLGPADASLVFWPDFATLVDRESSQPGVQSGTTYGIASRSRDIAGGAGNGVTWVVPPADLTGLEFTFSAWVRPDTIAVNECLFAVGSSSPGDAYQIRFSASGQIQFIHVRDGGGTHRTRTTTATVPVGQWTHVAVSVDTTDLASGIRVHLNGSEGSYTTSTDGSGGTVRPPDESFVVGNTTAGSQPYDGQIADVRVFDRVLTDDEIQHVRLESADDSGEFEASTISPALLTSAAWSSTYGPIANPRNHWATAREIGA